MPANPQVLEGDGRTDGNRLAHSVRIHSRFCHAGKAGLSTSILTAPMVFLGFGFALPQTGMMPHSGAGEGLHLVAEIALILLLFLDAAQIDLAAPRKRHIWPAHMLGLGLPLAIGLGRWQQCHS